MFGALNWYPTHLQMQATLRSAGAQHMKATDYKIFVDAFNDGTILKPHDAGYVITGLSLGTPPSLSGQFVGWDNEECRDFWRK